jgi:hypothetical protein
VELILCAGELDEATTSQFHRHPPVNIHPGQTDVGDCQQPIPRIDGPALRLPNLSTYSVSAMLKEIEALKTKIITYLLRLLFSSTTVLSDSHDASSTVSLRVCAKPKPERSDGEVLKRGV